MPTYEYRCDGCEHEFEQFQSIKADPVRKCPQCGKLKVRRLISGGGGILFKGSGFYITDYRSESYKKAASSDRDSASKPAGAGKPDSASKSDKPAVKAKAS